MFLIITVWDSVKLSSVCGRGWDAWQWKIPLWKSQLVYMVDEPGFFHVTLKIFNSKRNTKAAWRFRRSENDLQSFTFWQLWMLQNNRFGRKGLCPNKICNDQRLLKPIKHACYLFQETCQLIFLLMSSWILHSQLLF